MFAFSWWQSLKYAAPVIITKRKTKNKKQTAKNQKQNKKQHELFLVSFFLYSIRGASN